jgi:hypothetical protein
MQRPQLHFCLAVLVSFLTTTPAHAQGLHLIPGVEEIESDTIPDITLATLDRAPVAIYYNPLLTNRYGPLLTRFFLAHEYGHIARHHTRAGYADLPREVRDSIYREQDLQADCYAAGLPGPEARAATEAALRFFTRLAQFRFDSEHPTGSQRVERILLCLATPWDPAARGRGETGVEVGPVSGDPEQVRFVVSATPLGTTGYGASTVLWVDGLRVGTVSNLRFPDRLDIDRFGAGLHSYRLTMDVYSFDGQLQTSPGGSLSGRGQLLIRGGDRFRVDWVPGQLPSLVAEGE